MVNINFAKQDKGNTPYVSSHSSLLIVGKGDTEYKSIKIVYPSGLSEVEEIFGVASQLTVAYKEAKRVGAREVYLCNCYKFTDYIDVVELIAQNDFACVAPLFDFSTSFINPLNNKETYLAEVYSQNLGSAFTNLFFTEKHASLYEDIDHFIITMRNKNREFKEITNGRLEYGEDVCCVLNNLKDYKFANVVLASIISKSSLREYPQEDLGEVVYDITNNDIFDNELIYFSYDYLAKTTIENMLNYYSKPAPEKMLLISIIKNRINAALNYDEFSGKLVNAYTRIELEGYTKEILQSFVGELIQEFNVLDIKYERAGIGEINIAIYISIKPYNSIENIEMRVEV